MPIPKNDIKIISNDVLKINHFDTYIMCEYCFPSNIYLPKYFQNKRKCNFTKFLLIAMGCVLLQATGKCNRNML